MVLHNSECDWQWQTVNFILERILNFPQHAETGFVSCQSVGCFTRMNSHVWAQPFLLLHFSPHSVIVRCSSVFTSYQENVFPFSVSVSLFSWLGKVQGCGEVKQQVAFGFSQLCKTSMGPWIQMGRPRGRAPPFLKSCSFLSVLAKRKKG